MNCLKFALCVAVFSLFAQANPAIAQVTPELRTPPAPETPRINGPVIYGARPGHPFLYRIPCTGVRPMRFSVKRLPSSLTLDPHSGIISGIAPQRRGSYRLTLVAANKLGKTSRAFTLLIGDTLGLTPQMGWNDWYTHYAHPTDRDIRTAADAMVSSGMADYGYQFIDIDDAWARKPNSDVPDLMGPPRSLNGSILPNARFPDMKALTDYIHAHGLKAGIYSSPGPLTCARFEGSYGHEAADAQQFSQWGFDLLKYDLCSYSKFLKDHSQSELQKPYIKMGKILRNLDRDVVFNLCEYGLGDVWTWGKSVGGSSWRTTGDLGWVKGTNLPGFYSVGFANAALDAYAGPGGWNDPDYILIGTVGDARKANLPPQPTSLTPAEQYSYMSMWSLMASPLFFSGDMSKLDAFTLNILDNSEVIDVDQDPLGRQAKVLRHTPQELVLVKPMADGSKAIGLFNLSSDPHTITLDWKDIGLSGTVKVRDVWRQRDLGAFKDRFTSLVPTHDVALIRIAK
ncbi:MAG TPA: putative Ig domain-containing protein [Acidobacteriaceae bacterium]|nr:putative Ig domain-containing protein [Acidobacteriaceae bacterium]